MRVFAAALLAALVWVGTAGSAVAQSYGGVSRILEEEEKAQEAMREHCAGLMYRRLNAARMNAWRDLFNMSKSFADACGTIEDRFALSKAYEDMAYGLTMLNDPRGALRWAQACLDSNGMAVGCYARKAELQWQSGDALGARSSIARGIMAGERAIGTTKVEMERVRMTKPDPRAPQVYRTRYLRKWEQLENRLSALEESLQLVKAMQDGLDAASGDMSYSR